MLTGLLTVMDEMKVGKVIISKQKEDSFNFRKFIEIAEKKHIEVQVVGMGDVLEIEKGVYFEILWSGNSNSIKENVLNNNSIVCRLHYNNFTMLFTGDIEMKAEKQILQSYNKNLSLLDSTVLKVGHHGSKTSSTQEFIRAVKPHVVLIGVGENNKFGHPNMEVVKRIENFRCKDISNRLKWRNRDKSEL